MSYMVLMAAVSRLLGVPVKWTEDRLEHLMASSSATDRLGEVEAAFTSEGELTGLRFGNVVNLGAYIRAPEPASVYRMHSTSNGPYRVKNIAVENVLVVTNRMPAGLNRGYGGPQFYFALERIMDIAARGLGIDPVELRRRNFVRKDEFPYECPAGSVLDSGDYDACVREVLRLADYPALLQRRERARAEGKLFGIGMAVGVEPSGSNMAYVGLAQTPEQRGHAEPKSGANASVTIAMDPGGGVTVQLDSTPNGQGHATVAAQIVAQELGLAPEGVDVITEADTRGMAWSIASGNYSNRFAASVTSAVMLSARRIGEKLKQIAAEEFGVPAAAIELANGVARVIADPQRSIGVGRLAARAHWHPAGMPMGMEAGMNETVVLDAPSLTAPDAADRVASALTYGFVADLAAIDIDRCDGSPRSGQVRLGARCGNDAQSHDRRRPGAGRLRAWPRGGACSRSSSTTARETSSPGRSPSTCVPPRRTCRSSTSATSRPRARGTSPARRAWATAARCSRLRRSPTPPRTPSGARTSNCR